MPRFNDPVCFSGRRFVAVAFALLVSTSAISAPENPLPAKFDPTREAVRDLDTALQLARSTQRHVLVEIGGEWCTWCHIMDRFFAANGELKTLRDANFVWLKVNFSKENENKALLSRWPKVAGYPHLFVLGADGRLLHSQDTSALEARNSYDPIKFRAFLVDWSPK